MRFTSALTEKNRSFVSPRRGRRSQNAFAMTIILLPLTGLVGGSLIAVTQRTLAPYFNAASPECISQEIAVERAKSVGDKALGVPLEMGAAVRQSGYSVWRQSPVPIWEVTCRADKENYLIRINGLTGQAYGLNHLRTVDTAAEENFLPDAETSVAFKSGVTARSGEAAARRYLRAFGIAPRRASFLGTSVSLSPENDPCRIYRFGRRVAGLTGNRTMTVALNERTGQLEQMWNASGGL